MNPSSILTIMRRRRNAQQSPDDGGGKITLDLSPDAVGLLHQLMDQTKDTPADLFRKALALYKAAQDAHGEGKAVGVAASPDALETEFVGF